MVGPQAQAICPNCNHANSTAAINDRLQNPETGDRILVLKWPFDLGLNALGPARWDVVVFKDPADGSTNYIKRLVGLPGEVLMIVDGDVYTVPTDQLTPETAAELDSLRHEKYELRVGKQRGELRKVPREVFEELDTKMRIARKTKTAQKGPVVLWCTIMTSLLRPMRSINQDGRLITSDPPDGTPATDGSR